METKTANVIGKSIVANIFKAFQSEAAGVVKLQAKTDAAIQAAVDAMLVECKTTKKEFLKGNSRSNKYRKEVADLFNALSEAGNFSAKSAAQYASCFWVAFESGQPFSRSALNAPNDKARTPHAPAVKTVSIEALAAQAQKLVAMARLLGNDALAADLVDVLIGHVPDFEELPKE